MENIKKMQSGLSIYMCYNKGYCNRDSFKVEETLVSGFQCFVHITMQGLNVVIKEIFRERLSLLLPLLLGYDLNVLCV